MNLFNKYYLDNNNNPVLCEDNISVDACKLLKQNVIDNTYCISTLFFGIAISQKKNELFETRVYLKKNWSELNRIKSSSYKEALKQHELAIQWVKDGCQH